MSYYTDLEYTEFTDDMVLPIKNGQSRKLSGAAARMGFGGAGRGALGWAAAQGLLFNDASCCCFCGWKLLGQGGFLPTLLCCLQAPG